MVSALDMLRGIVQQQEEIAKREKQSGVIEAALTALDRTREALDKITPMEDPQITYDLGVSEVLRLTATLEKLGKAGLQQAVEVKEAALRELQEELARHKPEFEKRKEELELATSKYEAAAADAEATAARLEVKALTWDMVNSVPVPFTDVIREWNNDIERVNPGSLRENEFVAYMSMVACRARHEQDVRRPSASSREQLDAFFSRLTTLAKQAQKGYIEGITRMQSLDWQARYLEWQKVYETHKNARVDREQEEPWRNAPSAVAHDRPADARPKPKKEVEELEPEEEDEDDDILETSVKDAPTYPAAFKFFSGKRVVLVGRSKDNRFIDALQRQTGAIVDMVMTDGERKTSHVILPKADYVVVTTSSLSHESFRAYVEKHGAILVPSPYGRGIASVCRAMEAFAKGELILREKH